MESRPSSVLKCCGNDSRNTHDMLVSRHKRARSRMVFRRVTLCVRVAKLKCVCPGLEHTELAPGV